MNTRVLGSILGLIVLVGFLSCKKKEADDSVNGKFQGNWIESSAKQVSMVVSAPPAGDENLPNLRLISGGTTYFFQYRFNNAGDSVYLSDLSTGGARNIPYKISFSGDSRSLTIKKFHNILPETEPVTFVKQ